MKKEPGLPLAALAIFRKVGTKLDSSFVIDNIFVLFSEYLLNHYFNAMFR